MAQGTVLWSAAIFVDFSRKPERRREPSPALPGQAPLGVGLVFVGPIAAKLGKRNALLAGMVVSTVGAAICLLDPRNLTLVLAGQFIRTIGLIPGTYMVSSLLGDALDDVEHVAGQRCDGFSSSVFNCIITISGGIALRAF